MDIGIGVLVATRQEFWLLVSLDIAMGSSKTSMKKMVKIFEMMGHHGLKVQEVVPSSVDSVHPPKGGDGGFLAPVSGDNMQIEHL